MSNWTAITVDHLKAAGLGFIVDKAATTSTGSIDPVAEEIAAAVARVRRAITGSALDADHTKVPNSLRAVTVRMALYALCDRLRFPLSDDQKSTRRDDNSDLLRIADKRLAVELPDTPGGTAEMQQSGGVDALGVPRRQTGRDKCAGL